MKEAGVDLVYNSWFGIGAPKDTPKAIVDWWYREITEALQSPDMKAPLNTLEADIITGSHDDMVRSVGAQVDALAKLLRDAKIEPQ